VVPDATSTLDGPASPGPAPMEGVESGVALGRGEVEGEERNAEREVICVSVRSDTREVRGMERRERRREEVAWEMP
jgi:hypothetical protein